MMNWMKMGRGLVILVAILVVPFLVTKPARAAALACSWSVVSSPNVGSGFNSLVGVAALSSTNVWVVGNSTSGSGIDQTLIEEWNGTSWNVVSSPNVGSGHNTLDAVAALSATDIWTVGAWTNDSGAAQTLIEHWDGASWSVVSSPNGPSGDSILVGVSAVSATDIWAVGYTNFPVAPQTLTEHWNGTAWSLVPSPNVAGSSQDLLKGVKSVNARHVWAVGYYRNSSNTYQTLVEEWNGTSWSIISSPNAGSGDNFFNGVSLAGAGKLWAVGSAGSQTLIEEWNGTNWSLVTSPATSGSSALNAVAPASATNAWTVGNATNSSGTAQTLTAQWNGTSWVIASSPNVGSGGNGLNDVVKVPGSRAFWAVGNGTNASGIPQTLTLFHC